MLTSRGRWARAGLWQHRRAQLSEITPLSSVRLAELALEAGSRKAC